MSADDRDRAARDRKLQQAMELGMSVVWTPDDFDDLARHAEEAMALTRQANRDLVDKLAQRDRDKAQHPASQGHVPVQDDIVFTTCRRAQVPDPELAPQLGAVAPVVDLFTRKRVR